MIRGIKRKLVIVRLFRSSGDAANRVWRTVKGLPIGRGRGGRQPFPTDLPRHCGGLNSGGPTGVPHPQFRPFLDRPESGDRTVSPQEFRTGSLEPMRVSGPAICQHPGDPINSRTHNRIAARAGMSRPRQVETRRDYRYNLASRITFPELTLGTMNDDHAAGGLTPVRRRQPPSRSFKLKRFIVIVGSASVDVLKGAISFASETSKGTVTGVTEGVNGAASRTGLAVDDAAKGVGKTLKGL